jgi:HlyD family secretion protein
MKVKNSLISLSAYLLFTLVFFSSCSPKAKTENITASGTIEAVEVNLGSRMSGQVKGIFVDEGSKVKEGERLVLIDSSSLELQLKQARAGVELAEAQLDLLVKGARSEDIQQAEENLKQAEANLKVAEEDFNRARNLFEKESITQKQKDDAEARYAVVSAQFNSAKEFLKKLKQLARPEEIRAARARLSQAQAGAEILEKSISDCSITSPAAGIVTHKAVEAGEFVIPGTTVLTISKLDEVYLMIYVNEYTLGRVRLGQEAEVKVDSYPERVFPAKVVFISPEAEFTPKNIQTKEERVKLVFAVKIQIKNRDGALKAGMPADASLKTEPFDSRS